MLDRTHRRHPATSICPPWTLSIAMRVGTRHPRCVVLRLHIAVRRSDTARSPLCPSHRHPIFVSVHLTGKTVKLILRRPMSKGKEFGKRNRFLSIAACSKWGSSLRCVTTRVAFFGLTFWRRQRAAQRVDRAVQRVGDRFRNSKAIRRSAGRTYTFP